MEDDRLKDALREAVLEHLALEEEVVDNLTEFLITLGITEVAHLRLVKESDLVPGLTHIEARALLAGWSSKYGKGISYCKLKFKMAALIEFGTVQL